MRKKRWTRVPKLASQKEKSEFEDLPEQVVVPYDENLLERSRTQWQFGDWQSLVQLNRETLQHHPDRAKLALLAAAGRLQTGLDSEGMQFLRIAEDWGCSRRLIKQILVAGVHNTLGRAAALSMNQEAAIQHFEKALKIGMPGCDYRLLSHARILLQMSENGPFEIFKSEKDVNEKLADLYLNHAGYVSDKWELYLSVYESIFSNYRSSPISLLEIGIQNGGSLEIWEKFFKNAKLIVGCDIDQKCSELKYNSKSIKIVIGDIKSEETQSVILSNCKKFDIIIDDGSHKSSDIISAFCSLFPKLRQGGIYVIEDMHCSYWSGWEGGLDEVNSSMSFFKSIVDLLNHEHWESEIPMHVRLKSLGFLSPAEDVLAEIHSVKFYNSMCVIEKQKKNANKLGKRHVVGGYQNVCDIKKFDQTFLK